MQSTYSLHKITSTDTFSFSAAEYSRFKYGDDGVAEAFGTALAKGFIEDSLAAFENTRQLVVISSPYSFIPTATFAMKNHFVFTLNRWLSDAGRPVVQETKVHRTITYKEDYGELNATERMNLIGNDSFHIDKSFLQNKVLIFLDDIKITGTHERMITGMLEQHQLTNPVFLLYFAELTNKEIHPNIENQLNYAAVTSIFDLNSIIQSERFAVNTRIVKYILNSDAASFQIFIQNQAAKFINLLYDMAIGNGYHTIEAYAANMLFIRKNLLTKPIPYLL